MEYSYKISDSGSERSIILKNEVIIYIANGAIYDIPYKRITSVWLNKPSGFLSPNYFSCTLNIEDDKPIFISSKNWDDYNNEILQQNHYNSFVRVLHMHLKEKSKAKYGFGVKPKNYFIKAAAILAVLAVVLFLSVSLQLNNFLLAFPILVGGSALAIGINFCVKNYPHRYKPDHIPLQLLPAPS